MACLADNRRMQRIARKFDAERSFDFGSVVGEVEPWRANPLSMMQEFMADGHGFATAMLDLQSRMLWASLYPPFWAEFAALNETWPGVALDHERLVLRGRDRETQTSFGVELIGKPIGDSDFAITPRQVIIAWLKVRSPPSPPRIFPLTEISWLSETIASFQLRLFLHHGGRHHVLLGRVRPAKFCDDPTSSHDKDAVAQLEQFGSSEEMDRIPTPSAVS